MLTTRGSSPEPLCLRHPMSPQQEAGSALLLSGSLASLPVPMPPRTTPLCCPVKARWATLPHSDTLGAGSPVPSTSGPGPLCCPEEVQGPLSLVLKPVREYSYHSCFRAISASSPSYCKWQMEGITPAPMPLHGGRQVAGPALLWSLPQGLGHLSPHSHSQPCYPVEV